MTNLRSEISSYNDNGIFIYCCQVSKIDSQNEDYINNISHYTIVL